MITPTLHTHKTQFHSTLGPVTHKLAGFFLGGGGAPTQTVLIRATFATLVLAMLPTIRIKIASSRLPYEQGRPPHHHHHHRRDPSVYQDMDLRVHAKFFRPPPPHHPSGWVVILCTTWFYLWTSAFSTWRINVFPMTLQTNSPCLPTQHYPNDLCTGQCSRCSEICCSTSTASNDLFSNGMLSHIFCFQLLRKWAKFHDWIIYKTFQYTRWFKYDRDWFVCKQAALRSSCATLREWSHNLHPPSCSG